MTPAGHLFVVHGKIESLVHDAAVLPVDRMLAFNPIWRALLGHPWPGRPETWSQGWGRVEDREQWLIEVGDGDYSQVLNRLQLALQDIHRAAIDPSRGRVLPLVAIPVLGVGLGGHAHEPGRVVRALVTSLTGLAAQLGLDIALVTPDSSVYAAAQFARRRPDTTLDPRHEQLAIRLGGLVRRGEVALFLGAGVSIPAGLASWPDLIGHLARDVPSVTTADLAHLSATDQAELIERADPNGFQARVAGLVRPAVRPGLLHALLAGMDVRQLVTTNYDLLYELAVQATGRSVESVMPWDSALGAERWVLKLHGDVDHEDEIVLTRRHMVRYDAANRPSAALLQSLLLTKHLLVVGASFTDDNVVRLAHEVQAYRDEHQKGSPHLPFGTVLDASADGDRVRARLWPGQLDWIHLADLEVASPPRALELVLDRIGVYATRDSSWLLDERFAGLLNTDTDRELAAEARSFYHRLVAMPGSAWEPLIDQMNELGAR